MRRISRVPRLPIDQVGAALVGVLASVGLWLLWQMASTPAAGVGLTLCLALMTWYWTSVLYALFRWFRGRQLDRQDAEANGDFDYR